MKLGFETKGYFIAYQNNQYLADLTYQQKEDIADYIKKFPHSKDGNIWIDAYENICFSRYQYRKTIAGKDHHFCLPKDSYLKDGFWSVPFSKKIVQKYKFGDLQDYTWNSEMFFSKHKRNLDNKDKSVLIICGGPSVDDVKWENLEYDQIWACNEFYKSEKLKQQKIDLSIIVAGLFDFSEEKEFISYIEQKDLVALFELERGNSVTEKNKFKEVTKFYQRYPDNTGFCHTRYSSVLGIGPRLVVYAALTGFKNIYIVGLDGRSQVETNGNLLHAFDGNKNIPNWYNKFGDSMQEKQMVIFWEYMEDLSKNLNFNFYNLGEDHEHNVLSELFSDSYPLPTEIKEKLK
tara:strand:- start:10183 stop:11223 length:1041 start_codon:yes stop_codon:yes gene_type:complete